MKYDAERDIQTLLAPVFRWVSHSFLVGLLVPSFYLWKRRYPVGMGIPFFCNLRRAVDEVPDDRDEADARLDYLEKLMEGVHSGLDRAIRIRFRYLMTGHILNILLFIGLLAAVLLLLWVDREGAAISLFVLSYFLSGIAWKAVFEKHEALWMDAVETSVQFQMPWRRDGEAQQAFAEGSRVA